MKEKFRMNKQKLIIIIKVLNFYIINNFDDKSKLLNKNKLLILKKKCIKSKFN